MLWDGGFWGFFLWDAATPDAAPVRGGLRVTAQLRACCAVAANITNCLEVSVIPISLLQSNVLRLTLRFRDQDGQLADPTVVTLRLLQPGGTEVSPSPIPTRLSTGVWTYDLDTEGLPSGVWTYRAEGHGLVDAAAEGTFTIVASQFT